MATVTPTPLYFKDAIITIGTDDYAAAVSSGALTPNVSSRSLTSSDTSRTDIPLSASTISPLFICIYLLA